MAQYLTEAIILAVRNWGEADKMVTLLSRDHGKIIAIAYGCRRPKNRLAGAIQVFSQVELALMSGHGIETIKQCELKQSFRKIREDLQAMAYAAFANELVVEFCPDRQPEPYVYDLLVQVLTTITCRNPRLVALAAAWQLLALVGYQAQYDHCVICGQPLSQDAFFDSEKGGGVCKACKQQDLPEMSERARRFLDQLLYLDWEQPPSFTVSGAVLLQSEKILTGYITCLLGKPLKSLEFIKQVSV
jgi:DNA repair protein RecO (recombination protein O)